MARVGPQRYKKKDGSQCFGGTGYCLLQNMSEGNGMPFFADYVTSDVTDVNSFRPI